MNERIRELAEQAGIAVWGDAVYMYNSKDTLDSTVMKKFAELIVWDCIEAIDAKEYTMGGDTEAKGMRFSINIIKKHFGVEE